MKIGIFPYFSLLGEVNPSFALAEIIKDLGNEVVFFSHGGKFEKIIKDFSLIRISPEFSDGENERILYFHINQRTFKPLISSERLEEMVKEEVKTFEREKIDAIISFFQFTTPISAKLSKIPLFSVVSGVWTYPFLKKNLPFRKYLIFHYFPYALHPLNYVSKKLGLKGFKNTLELTSGDITLVTDSPEIIGIPKKEMERFYPNLGTHYFYIGPLLLSNENFRKTKEASILCTMGSSTPLFYLKECYQALKETSIPSIFIVPEDKISFFPSTKKIFTISSFSSSILENVDMVIIHGGRNTVRWTSWAGKPFLGVGMQIEQELNLKVLERKGMGIRISKRNFRKNRIKKFVNKILGSKKYKENSRKVKKIFRDSLSLNKRIDEIIKINL